jgi:four helix bundle suffix protein
MGKFVVKRSGNYRDLLCYCKVEAIYDITYFFANKFLKPSDRTIDQMVQAARSGKQNIIEGYAASVTSIETEIKLLGVAKSSLKELLADYEDYLRNHNLEQWCEDSEKFKTAQQLGKEHNDSEYWMEIVKSRSDETIANIAIILLNQADYLLYRFMEKVVEKFEKEGGIREQLYRLRSNK